jgi:RecJ-like exonuclease
LEEIEKVAKIVKSLTKQKNVKIFSHYDGDGLAAASILVKTFLREGINFELRIFKQLTSEIVSQIKASENDFLIFVDFGSGQLDLIKPLFEKTHVLILDHHEPKRISHLNLFHLNPLLFADEEISSSIVSYFFAKFFDWRNSDLADIAIVGAIADMQDEKWELKGLAKKVLKEAIALGKITVTKGLRIYGRNLRPIHKALAFSFDPFIPDITGSESQAVQFLSELGIKVKEEDEWKKLSDLSIEEQRRLASAIIIERLRANHSEAEDIFGEIYTLANFPSELKDAREFATILNACGRTGNANIGIRICLNDFSCVSKSYEILNEYRKLISNSLKLIREKEIVVTKNFSNFILAEEKIPESLIGTITSIVLRSNLLDAKKPIFGLAFSENGKVKISARVSRDLNINLKEILAKAIEKVGGEVGGHKFAAGGLIKKGKEKEFIEIIDNLLSNYGCKER